MISKKSIIISLLWLEIAVLIAYIVYPLYLYFNWKFFLIAIIVIGMLQLAKALMVRFTYQPLIKRSSIPYTIIAVYVFGATIFYIVANILISIFKYWFL